MEDDLEATQVSFSAPQTQEELDDLLESMGASRPTRTIGATLSPTLTDDAGNPVPVDRFGEPIIFETNPDYDPDAKPSFENFKNNMSEMASGLAEGAEAFFSDPAGTVVDTANAAGTAVLESGQQFGERIQTGNTTLQDVFDTVATMLGAGPATSVATKGVKATAADLADPNTSRMFLTSGSPGVSASMQSALDDAINMQLQGVDPLKIKQDTGWENFAGKEWVYEIDDSTAHTRDSAQAANATKEVTITKPGGPLSPKDRQTLLLQAQRDKIELKKSLKAGDITEQEYKDLLVSRQEALDRELQGTTEDKTVTKKVPLAPTLKNKGKLTEVFYHPELAKYLDYSDYTAEVGLKEGKKTAGGTVLGDHNRQKKHINIYKQTPLLSRRNIMIHEGQHFLDAKSGSMGSGFSEERAETLVNNAKDRYQDAMNYLDAERGSNPSIIEDTSDMLDILGFGMTVTRSRLLDLVDDSLNLVKQPDGSYESVFDMDRFKAAMKDAGNESPDTTIGMLEEQRPDILSNIEKIANVRGSAARELGGMSAFRAYENELGEVKARVAETRANLDPDKRANTLASDDIKYSDGLMMNTRNIYTPDEYQ